MTDVSEDRRGYQYYYDRVMDDKVTSFVSHKSIYTLPNGSYEPQTILVDEQPDKCAVLMERYQFVKYIESGGIGRGWVARDLTPTARASPYVFLKTYRTRADFRSEQEFQMFEYNMKREIAFYQFLHATMRDHHPNVVNVLDVGCGEVKIPKSCNPSSIIYYTITELCAGGELFNYVKGPFDERFARVLFKQLINGVNYLHSKNLYHRDLKLENLVLSSDYTLKIMDFGMAKQTTMDRTSTYDVGTQCYLPPEVRLRQGYDYDPSKVDIWMTGLIFFYLLGFHALKSYSNRNPNSVLQGSRLLDSSDDGIGGWLDDDVDSDNIPRHIKFWDVWRLYSFEPSPSCRQLMNAMLTKDPSRRYCVSQILAHEWMTGEVPSREEIREEMFRRCHGIDLPFSNDSAGTIIRVSPEASMMTTTGFVDPLSPSITLQTRENDKGPFTWYIDSIIIHSAYQSNPSKYISLKTKSKQKKGFNLVKSIFTSASPGIFHSFTITYGNNDVIYIQNCRRRILYVVEVLGTENVGVQLSWLQGEWETWSNFYRWFDEELKALSSSQATDAITRPTRKRKRRQQ